MIFLLGGNGYVGSGFARLFATANVPFEIITRANYDSFIGRSCDLLINANGNSSKILGKTDPKREFRESVVSVRDSLADFTFGTYLFLSTSDVYPDSSSPETTAEDGEINIAAQSPYGFHKYLAEQCVRHAAQRWLIVRQGGFVGPGMKKNAVFDVLHGDKLWVHPETQFQYIHTSDSAEACMSLLDLGVTNEVVNVSARGTIAVREVMELAGRNLPAPADAAPGKFEISVDRAAQYVSLPTTRDCVVRFLADENRLDSPK